MSDLPTLRSKQGAPDGQRLIPARRRMLKIGASTAPVMLTLFSRPVRAGQCVTGSAFVGSSVATSHAPKVNVCSGANIQTWIAATTWPDPYKKTTKNGAHGWNATLYHCPTTVLGGTTFSSKTMLDVMQLSAGTGIQGLGRYVGAALLNARAGKTPVLSEATVRNMWNAVGPVGSLGYYEPTAGIRWGPAEIIAYIKTTMG